MLPQLVQNCRCRLVSNFVTNSFVRLDPNMWSVEHTTRWANDICQQLSINMPKKLNITGKEMMEMSQEDFCARIGDFGDTLHAQFQLWKTAFVESHNQQKAQNASVPNMATSIIQKTNNWNASDSEAAASANFHEQVNTNLNTSPMMPNEHLSYYNNFNNQMNYSPSMVHQQQPAHNFYNNTSPFHQPCSDTYYPDYTNTHVLGSPSESDVSSSSSMADEDIRFIGFEQQNRLSYDNTAPYLDMGYDGNVLLNSQNPMICPVNQSHSNGMSNFPILQNANTKLNNYHQNAASMLMTKSSSGSIHLWHFIRELLENPKDFANCVRWVDKNEGLCDFVTFNCLNYRYIQNRIFSSIGYSLGQTQKS